MEKKFYTDDELIVRMWDKEEVKDVMAKHAFYHTAGQHREELVDIWVTKPENRRTASLGFNTGYYVGMDDISNFYVVQHDQRMYERLKPYCEADPGLEYNNLNLGLGVMEHHTSNTPLVYIAEDGRSAKYLGYDCGEQTVGAPDGSAEAYFVFGLVLADLLKEDGKWKIWHLVLERDHTIAAGSDYAQVPVELEPGQAPLDSDFGEPTIKRLVHDNWIGWEYLYQDMPKPYYTYEATRGYGPEGCLGLKYYERERRGIYE
jgi:hypothetical protein